MKKYVYLSTVFLLVGSMNVSAMVNDITGDTGSAQSGSLTLSGGTSGAVFNSTTPTITESFNYLSLPSTNSTDGQILIANNTVLHAYNSSNQNIFVGQSSGNFTTTCGECTGCGVFSLNALTEGIQNTAIGKSALINLQDGSGNTAIGYNAGSGLISGGDNIFVGSGAGSSYVGTESHNIIIGSNPASVNESNTIRIGGGQSQTACYMDGIYGQTVSPDTGLAVFIDDMGKMGTLLSSLRFKENVHDVTIESNPLLNLRVVSFNLSTDAKKIKQYGLIAEEVYKICPELVVLDKKGEPFAVKYHLLPVLLLKQLQDKSQRVDKLEKKVKALTRLVDKLSKIIELEGED